MTLVQMLDKEIATQETKSKDFLSVLSGLKPAIHKIEGIVSADKEYTKHAYCYNVLMDIKERLQFFKRKMRYL
jgi:hypothetical protein